MYALSNEESIFWFQKVGIKSLNKMLSSKFKMKNNFELKNGKTLNDPLNILKRKESLMDNEIFSTL